MKSFILAVFVIVACTAVSLADDEKYTSKYDNVDIDKILENDRLLKNYIACVDGSGKCTPDGEELKSEYRQFLYNLRLCVVKMNYTWKAS